MLDILFRKFLIFLLKSSQIGANVNLPTRFFFSFLSKLVLTVEILETIK